MTVELRPMILADAEALASWAIDPVFCAHAGWSHRPTATDAVSWWRDAIAAPSAELIRLTVIRDGEVVGYVDLHGDDDDERELGFVIGPSTRWRQGLGAAAAEAGLVHGFTLMGLSRIWAEALEANTGSTRILRRIGMSEIGAGDDETFLGARSRYLQFRLTRDEWSSK